MRQLLYAIALLWLANSLCQAGEVTVAVASNFQTTAAELADTFTAAQGHTVRISSASTGTLYNQIRYGAGFDVLLAADIARPQQLEHDGLTVAGSRFTYAIGELVLLAASAAENATATAHREQPACTSRAPCSSEATAAAIRRQLQSAPPRSVAIANPALAPYGFAAQKVYEHLGLWDETAETRVMGGNIAQAYQFVATGNARLGFVALAQITDAKSGAVARHWPIPAGWHPPIEQQAVWLQRAADNRAAAAFMTFLRSPAARAIIERHGYRLP